MVLRIHGKDESVVRFRQGAPSKSKIHVSLTGACFFIKNKTMIGETCYNYKNKKEKNNMKKQPSFGLDIEDDVLLGIGECKDTEIIIPDGVIAIAEGAFEHCSSLTSITIPNSVTSIGEGAFYMCSSLVSIVIPDSVTSIANGTFANCYSLTNITIPNSITSIGNCAISHCYSLTSIIIPDSVISIDDGAFANCTSLTNITIPNSVTSIGYDAFFGCRSLESITFRGTMEQWNAITKGSNMWFMVPTTVVHCVDGDVTI